MSWFISNKLEVFDFTSHEANNSSRLRKERLLMLLFMSLQYSGDFIFLLDLKSELG